MPQENNRQFAIDNEHLKLLTWGYVISGILASCFSVLGLLYAFMGIFMGVVFSHAPVGKATRMLPGFVASIFAGIGLVIFLFLAAIAVARFWTAHCLSERKSRTFCFVVAAITCMEFPLGTALGVCSLVVLGRPSVIELFSPKPAGLNIHRA
jgi:hypothetical protein